jgi:hypothetical protein
MQRALHRLVPMLLAFAAPGAFAQTPAPATPPASPCADPQHRQFDFWVGNWNVTPNQGGPLIGRSRVESRIGDCVVHEHWFGKGDHVGESFNIYNAATGQWEQFWVADSGNRLYLHGGMVGASMVIEGDRDRPDPKSGVLLRDRITYTPNADGSVRQLWEISADGGKTWNASFDGLYRKAATPVP